MYIYPRFIINQLSKSVTESNANYVRSFFLAATRKVWHDFDRDERHFPHNASKATSDIVGTRDLTIVLIYSSFLFSRHPVLFLPLRLLLLRAFFPNMASRANAVASLRSVNTSFPG